jgi:hypothetical protein
MNLTAENKKRIIIFLAFAFGISWVTALVIFITGGLKNSSVLDSTSGLSLAYMLLTNRRDLSWYSLDALIRSLKKEFPKVTTFPSSPSGRILCFCER